jgi:hypothetical protein
MAETPNPFTNRGTIKSPEDFFGRQRQIEKILTRLRTMQSASVVGERRIGKSSLLYHLMQTGAARIGDENYRFLYLDLQEAALHTAPGFLKSILNKLGAPADTIKADETLNRNLSAFGDQVAALEQTGQRIVLCLDEFENAFKHRAQFDKDFFDHFRSMLNARKLAIVTATQRKLQSLSLEGKLTSPFYNIFTVVELKEFTEAEAHQFVAAYHQRVGFTDVELKLVFSYLDPHPLKLQIVCDLVLENRREQLSDWALAEEIAKEYGNFFVGKFDSKQLLKAKKAFSLDKIKKLLDTLKVVRDTFKG